jgi:hypothetical protein
MTEILQQRCLFLFLITALAFNAPLGQSLVDSALVDMVPSSFPVGFDLLTEGKRQYIAYYDSTHAMTIALHAPGSSIWTKKTLPTKIAWDSHNYVTMALDRKGNLHVSGNLHTNPLIYFQTTKPYDINTLQKIPTMVSVAREASTTYPEFVKDPSGDLYFLYRQGSSGNGVWYLNKFDDKSNTWSAQYGGTSIFGNTGGPDGFLNAYFNGPKLGPDGRFHMFFLWRDTPDASTCHDAGYIRSISNNLDAWETVDGKPVTLPLSVTNKSAIFDTTPVKQGLINMGLSIGFDSHNRVVLSYHRYDSAGISQIYNARYDSTRKTWQVVQASSWIGYRWDFSGGGSIADEISSGAVTFANGKLTQTWRHEKFGKGTWLLDEATLKPIGNTAPDTLPLIKTTANLGLADSLIEKRIWDKGAGEDPFLRYCLRWATQGPNRDVKPTVITADSRLEILTYRYSNPISIVQPERGHRGSDGTIKLRTLKITGKSNQVLWSSGIGWYDLSGRN